MIFSEPPPSQCRWSRPHLRSKDYTGSSCSSSSAFRLQWPRSWPWPHTLHIVELQQRMQREDFKGGCREEVFGDVYGGRIQILGRCGWVEEREREIYKIPDLNITFSQNIFNTNKRNWDGQLLRPLWSFYLFLFFFLTKIKHNLSSPIALDAENWVHIESNPQPQQSLFLTARAWNTPDILR